MNVNLLIYSVVVLIILRGIPNYFKYLLFFYTIIQQYPCIKDKFPYLHTAKNVFYFRNIYLTNYSNSLYFSK